MVVIVLPRSDIFGQDDTFDDIFHTKTYLVAILMSIHKICVDRK